MSEAMSTGREQPVRLHSGVFERAAYRIWWRLLQQSATWPGRVSMKAELRHDGMAQMRAAGAEESWHVVAAGRAESGGVRVVRSRARWNCRWVVPLGGRVARAVVDVSETAAGGESASERCRRHVQGVGRRLRLGARGSIGAVWQEP